MANQYEKVNLIGSGSFGKVWLVRHNATGKRCVIKEVSVANMTEKGRTQTLTEVEVLARCRHINVVRYKETFLHNGSICIAMSYAEGGDLHAKIQSQQGMFFEEQVILDWFVQICFALRYIHGMNILHRDLKTHNIFLTGENIIKIGDFGIARVLSHTTDLASTAVGTPYYLSPEICQHQPYNYKSDMWAAGCVLYELCCLRPPFDGHSFAALVVCILNGSYERIPIRYSATLEDLVSVLLRGDATSRPSADQVLWVPALQDYVKAHVMRTAALTNKQRQPSPAPMQEHQRMKSSDEKENINPSLGKARGRRRSMGTPKTDALQKVEYKRVANSAECYRKTPRKIKESGAPTLSLYKEVLRRAIKQPPPMRQNREVLAASVHQRKSNKLAGRTYKIHHDEEATPNRGATTNKYERTRSPFNREAQRTLVRTPTSTQGSQRSTIEKKRGPSRRTHTVSRDPELSSNDESSGMTEKSPNVVPKEQEAVPESSVKLKQKEVQASSGKPSGPNSCFESRPVSETVKMLYTTFCKDQASAYPLMESLRQNLEETMGSDRLNILRKSVGNALRDGISLDMCIHDLDDNQLNEMPSLLHLLQLEAIADI